MFAATCRAEKVEQVTKFLHLVATTDWSLFPAPQHRTPSEVLLVNGHLQLHLPPQVNAHAQGSSKPSMMSNFAVLRDDKTPQNSNIPNQTNNQQWTTFTYFSPKIRKITNILKATKVNIAFRTTNTLANNIKPKNNQDTRNPDNPIYLNNSGVYKLSCRTCDKVYIGQTNRNITVRYNEHTRYKKSNKPQSAYTEHILKNRHEYGSLQNTTRLIKPINRPSKLIPYEQLFIHRFFHTGTLIPEQNCYDNPMFKLANTVDTT